jgi:hypothetical protein
MRSIDRPDRFNSFGSPRWFADVYRHWLYTTYDRFGNPKLKSPGSSPTRLCAPHLY